MSDLLTQTIKDAVREAVREALAAMQSASPQTPKDPGELLGVHEAATRLRCSTRTVRRYISTGRLRAARLGGGSARVLIARGEIDRLVSEAT